MNWKVVASPSLFHVEIQPRKKGDAAEKKNFDANACRTSLSEGCH